MSGKNIPPLQTPSHAAGPTSANALFDPILHSQGGCPHLIQHLLVEYRGYIGRANQVRAEQEQRLLDPEAAIRAARPLLDFFESYLRTHRPVQVFPIDMNYGVVLSNNARVAVSPGTPEVQGTMQDSGAIQVSHGMTQPGQEGVVPFHGYGVE